MNELIPDIKKELGTKEEFEIARDKQDYERSVDLEELQRDNQLER